MPALRRAFAAIVRLPEAAVIASEYMGFVWREVRNRADGGQDKMQDPGLRGMRGCGWEAVARNKEVWRLDAGGSCGRGQSEADQLGRHRHFVRH